MKGSEACGGTVEGTTVGAATGEGNELVPDLPQSELARQVLQVAVAAESTPIVNHSVRSYLFATILGAERGMLDEVDGELLFAACVLHDLGLSAQGDGPNRFEIDGADAAAQFLTGQHLAASAVDSVWEAIALHSSAGLAQRRSPLCALTQAGIWADFGPGSDPADDRVALAIHQRYPRLGLAEALVGTIVAQAAGRPAKAPRYSLSDAVIQERATTGLSRMERDEATSRWAALGLT